MGKIDKTLQRFLAKPKDFTYNELKRLLNGFGYKEVQGRGSRVLFVNENTGASVNLHKPHPKPIIKRYKLDQVEEHLRNEGLI